MRTLLLRDTNTFYAPAEDDCWVILAKEIMTSYANSYASLIPTTAISQNEYDFIDKQKFAPQRKSILKRVKHGPLKSVVDMPSVFSAFEERRRENLRSWGVRWKDNFTVNLDNL